MHAVHVHAHQLPSATSQAATSRNGERKVVTTNYWNDRTAALHVGDARHVLAQMPDGSADCIVTSPPYWGKPDYGVAGQNAPEPAPTGYPRALRAPFTPTPPCPPA